MVEMSPIAYLRLHGLQVGLNSDGKVSASGPNTQKLLPFMQANKPEILAALRDELLAGEEFADSAVCGFLYHLETIADQKPEPNRLDALRLIWEAQDAGFDQGTKAAKELGWKLWPQIRDLLENKSLEGAELHYAVRRTMRQKQPDLSVLD